MKIKNQYIHRKAIIITPDRLKDLEKIISEYYSHIEYTAELENGSNITFDNLDELLEQDNFKKRRINNITIYSNEAHAYGDLLIRIAIDIVPGINYTKTVVVNYKFDDQKKEREFLNSIKDNLDKSNANKLYSIASKISILWLIYFISMLIAFRMNLITHLDSYQTFIFTATSSVIIVTLGTKYNSFFTFLFPPIVFLWNEEIKREKMRLYARNIIFGLIIGILGSIIASKLLNL